MTVKSSVLLALLVNLTVAPLTNAVRAPLKAFPVRRAQDGYEGEAAGEAAVVVEEPEAVEVAEGEYQDPEAVGEEGEPEAAGEEGEEGVEGEAEGDYYEPDYQIPEEPEPGVEETFDVNFESEEIKETLAMVEYKMMEVNELMKECIEEEFAADLMADKDQVMTECVGLTYQILFFNFQESMRRVKQIFMELLKEKLSHLSEQYLDETEFFLDILEDFVDKDYLIKDSLEIAKSTSKYYVSPRFFDSLIDIATPEIDAFTELHNRLRAARTEIQDLMDEKLREREKYLDSLKGEVEKLEEVVEPEPEPMLPPEEPEEIYQGEPEPEGEELEEEEYEEPEEEEEEAQEEEPLEDEELPHEALESGEDNVGGGEEAAGGAAGGASEGGEAAAEGGAGGEGGEAGAGVSAGGASGEERLKRRRMVVRRIHNPYRRPFKKEI